MSSSSSPCINLTQLWDAIPLFSDTKGTHTQLRNRESGRCLTSKGAVVPVYEDPWCIANNNMWRSNTVRPRSVGSHSAIYVAL